ncbi:C2H2 finger domain protein [Penicillium argentinense]|uniref:C2H2 finger domain protein n=1 Tax=Penicillium argentinense TaxID=1131581 RepID=A0A9W9KL28_9EURO|nr:C2H2 finger domain protein [Penicillium argentinense]KAJ5110714.1 C2H2 finger domain protein [Penicillium argentinense]
MQRTESARAALASFTCSLCNKSYARHPEYEAHMGSYDHQHRRRLQDLKQLSRDPNAAEKAQRAERKANEKAGLRVVHDDPGKMSISTSSGGGASAGKVGGGFKKGGFKSSFAPVKGPAGVAPMRKNVLGGDDDNDGQEGQSGLLGKEVKTTKKEPLANVQDEGSDTDEEYAKHPDGGGYYDPRRPTGCFAGCAAHQEVKAAS